MFVKTKLVIELIGKAIGQPKGFSSLEVAFEIGSFHWTIFLIFCNYISNSLLKNRPIIVVV